jgi:hypothetical protein
MKKLIFLLILVLFLTSCAPAVITPVSPVPTTIEMIEPGDRIDEMSFRIAKNRRDWGITFLSFCNEIVTDFHPEVLKEECELPRLGRVFIGYGISGDSVSDLDVLWPTLTWEMYFDEQPVNLSAFGTIDDSYAGNKYRSWNVVLEKPAPGDHVLRFVVHKVDEPDGFTEMIWNISVKQ